MTVLLEQQKIRTNSLLNNQVLTRQVCKNTAAVDEITEVVGLKKILGNSFKKF